MTEEDARSSERHGLVLEDLVGDVASFFRGYWAREPVLMRARSDVTTLISEREIWEEADCGLLSRPYFTVFNEGVRTAIGDMTTSRHVAGHELSGYIDVAKIRSDFAAGATFKFSQVEHWQPSIRALVQALQPHFNGGLEAFVFLSPPGKTAMRAHTDGAHVFIIQVAGVKNWVIGKLDDTSHSNSTLHEGEISRERRLEWTLTPGDVVYMPHGCPHYATAVDGNSIHVAVTIEEPTAIDLAGVYLAELARSREFAELTRRQHLCSVSDTMGTLRHLLAAFLKQADSADVLETAIRLRKLHQA
jgi:ribosomal protein L16 Arg81 hydroxylase